MSNMHTKFAPSERSSEKEITDGRGKVLRKALFIEAINAFPEIVLFLDKNRQVVFCNEALLGTLGIKTPAGLLGKRPGEIFGCVNACKEDAGCGTSVFCAECGAVNAILAAQKGKQRVEECRMLIAKDNGEEALDLRVWAVPMNIEKELFTIFTIKDIGDEKRRELLERTFFHDILNEVSIISGYSENVKAGFVEADEEMATKFLSIATRMVETIREQRDLLSAETNTLELSKTTFLICDLLAELTEDLQGSKWCRGKEIILECEKNKEEITTDRVILGRVLLNLIKNALEASKEGEAVTVGYKKEGDKNIICVNNRSVMQKSVQNQIFQRSFSTKGKGRGIGTYSVKLFTEKHLNGKVFFTSKEGEGTSFFVEI
jgi:signal transduction histidine kinase